MNYSQDKPPKRRVAEPVQVYLRPSEKDRLERLTAELDTTKSDVLRRGLKALELQISDPEHHPALKIIGMVSVPDDDLGIDVAREHDEYLAATEIASWSTSPKERAES
ncbi:MAG: hypothetical protein F4179_03055 [Gammaproteobacteria bacterium]|nr:hypothetical protein [Gammaproteobacteria bacterium]MXY32472.1 hypothetical protein [Gammaproteobacteria bacterium]MYC98296.1 hypothetical protein [Gammaproteobacteria bacterium]MYF60645.1 hypothetical protein [Gammaproteobacteria bacterium]